jgi:Holliday junction DNA helicase RuvA
MICHLRGTLLEKHPTMVVVEVGGVGFAVHIPLSSYERLGVPGCDVTLRTYLYVREDSIQVYGFLTDDEKELFVLLLGVSGIGPKLALSILSGRTTSEFRRAVAEQDLDALAAVPGIGKKTAQRLVFELREKITGVLPSLEDTTTAALREAEAALLSLGYRASEARRLVRRTVKTVSAGASVEEVIKAALRNGG